MKYLEFCDDIMVLEDGNVREAGSHQTLMKVNGRYAQMISNYHMEQSKVRTSRFVFPLMQPWPLLFLLFVLIYNFNGSEENGQL